MAHALVFGASGISGWALVKQALSYPSPTTFAKVTGLTNRPYTIEGARLPNDDRLQLVSGIDLTASTDDVVKALKEKVRDVNTVSHVFFAAYIDPGKGYGVEFPDKVSIKAPLKESYPRIPKPYYDNIFYYTQCDKLASLSKTASWTWTEVRPDVIIGFVPGSNFMNCAQGLGLYLSLYRAVHGDGASVVFPGTEKSWTCRHTDTSQDILAKFEIYAALNADRTGDGRAFNIVDGDVTSWEAKWPGICAYFGLRGAGPGDFESPEEFAKKHAKVWEDVVQKKGLQGGRLEGYGWGFLDFVMRQFDFDRQYDTSRAREVGFEETVDTVKGYTIAFDRMREAKVIP